MSILEPISRVSQAMTVPAVCIATPVVRIPSVSTVIETFKNDLISLTNYAKRHVKRLNPSSLDATESHRSLY